MSEPPPSKRWKHFKKEMKDKRLKQGKIGTRRSGESKMEELIVQHLSSTVSGKAQKFQKIGARELVQLPYEELTIPCIKNARVEDFRERVEDVTRVRKERHRPEKGNKVLDALSSSSNLDMKSKSVNAVDIPKSLSISVMLKLGRSSDKEVTPVEIFNNVNAVLLLTQSTGRFLLFQHRKSSILDPELEKLVQQKSCALQLKCDPIKILFENSSEIFYPNTFTPLFWKTAPRIPTLPLPQQRLEKLCAAKKYLGCHAKEQELETYIAVCDP
eukprot:gene21285-23359_t